MGVLPETMRALVYEGPSQMSMREEKVPKPEAGELLIRVSMAGICGSELGGYLGHNSLRKPPLIMGHEFSGAVAAVGAEPSKVTTHAGEAGSFSTMEARSMAAKPKSFQIGDRVTVNPLVSCGRCARCVEGMAHLCSNRKLLGAGLPGAYAEYVKVPVENAYLLPDSVSNTEGAFTEPFACATHVCRLLDLQPHNRLLIIGAGPIGLFTLQAALGYGVKDIAVIDLNEDRLAIAQEIGAVTAQSVDRLKASFLPADAEPLGFFDAAVDAVGMTVTRNQCIQAVRLGGKVVFSGLHEADSYLPVNVTIRNELTLMGSFAYTREDFETALQWIIDKRVSLLNWTETAPLEDGAQCFEKLIRQPGKVAKIILCVGK